MKKSISKLMVLCAVPFLLLGCNQKKEEPITNKEESTIIKNAKNTDEYVNKKDYKSLAYAFIYNIKEGLQSYESETNGTVKAKVTFFDYNIKYHTVTHKNGNVFYSKDNSTSTLLNVKNEFYMVNKEKILVSRDLKKYTVYTCEDYHKISYSPDQYLIMGYVFNDQSIIKSELLVNEADKVSVKYTLDNVLATNFVKVDMKNNGGLSSYPEFQNIEITLSMKKDFTPISYAIDAVYDASKPIIGTTRTTQNGECLFSKVNEKITIENEAFLIEQLGAKPSEVVIDDKEQSVKDELLDAVKKLDFEHGVNVNGVLSLDIGLTEKPLDLNIDANLIFDLKRLSDEKLYEVLSFYAKLQGDETFNSLISLVKQFAGDKLGEYADLLDNFKSLEIVYDGAGSLYLSPVNQSDVQATMLKIKLVDIVDLILQRVNVYNLVSGANNDLVSFKKIEEKDANNYKVEITLNEDTIASMKADIEKLFEKQEYALIKTLLGYQDLDDIKAIVTVVNGVVDSLDASFSYLKSTEEGQPGKPTTLLALHLVASSKTFDFATKVDEAQKLYESYTAILDLKARIVELEKNMYVSRAYLENVNKALEEYAALSEKQKDFVGRLLVEKLEIRKTTVNNFFSFLAEYRKYDTSVLNNQKIYELLKLYNTYKVNSDLLKQEIGEEEYLKITSLSDSIDYSSFDGAVSKLVGEDENAWGLSEQEIRDIKLLFDIAQYDSGVKSNLWVKLLMNGIMTDIDVIEAKINNLYNNLPNA